MHQLDPPVLLAFGIIGSPDSPTFRLPAINAYPGYMEWNADAANDSLTKVVAFLRQTLAAR